MAHTTKAASKREVEIQVDRTLLLGLLIGRHRAAVGKDDLSGTSYRLTLPADTTKSATPGDSASLTSNLARQVAAEFAPHLHGAEGQKVAGAIAEALSDTEVAVLSKALAHRRANYYRAQACATDDHVLRRGYNEKAAMIAKSA